MSSSVHHRPQAHNVSPEMRQPFPTEKFERPRKRPPITQKMLVARFKYHVWSVLIHVVFAAVYIAIIAEGFRILIPTMAQRLYKLPGLGILKEYEATYKLDVAICMSIFMMLAVLYLWHRLVEKWLGTTDSLYTPHCDDEGWSHRHHMMLLWSLGAVVLGCDTYLFYTSIVSLTWGDSEFSFTSFVATLAYLAILVFVSYISVILRKDAYPKEKSNVYQ